MHVKGSVRQAKVETCKKTWVVRINNTGRLSGGKQAGIAGHSVETRPEEADDDVYKFIPMGANRRAELCGLARRLDKPASWDTRFISGPENYVVILARSPPCCRRAT
jgi:hypothetical protein